MWITLCGASLRCSCAGFYFMSLLTKFTAWTLAVPVLALRLKSYYFCTRHRDHKHRRWGQLGKWPLHIRSQHWSLSESLVLLRHLQQATEASGLLWPSAPPVWAQVLRPTFSGPQHSCHDVRGPGTRYRLLRVDAVFLVKGPEPVCTWAAALHHKQVHVLPPSIPLCSKACSAVPHNFRDKRTKNFKTVPSRWSAKMGHFSAQGPVSLSHAPMKPVLDDMLRNLFFLLTENGKPWK